MMDCEHAVASLTQQVLRMLHEHPSGLGEYQLIQRLRAAGCPWLPASTAGDTLALFRTHFLLFHCLYRLRDQLHGEQCACLAIGPLHIGLLPYQAGPRGLVHDPLRAYYLDLRRLFETGREEVEQLLKSFWEGLDPREKKEALRLFSLDAREPLDARAIRRRYRQLASAHHPDRGGSTERMQSINAALQVLLRHYR